MDGLNLAMLKSTRRGTRTGSGRSSNFDCSVGVVRHYTLVQVILPVDLEEL